MAKPVIVIGAGVGGLAAAIRLAACGYSVTILEKNPRVGGKLNQWIARHPHRPGDRPFTFDTGPSLLTLPFVFDDLFTAAGEDVRDWLPIRRLDPIARFQWSDGMRFELRSDRDSLLDEVKHIAPEDVQGFANLLDRGKQIWDRAAEMFLFHAPEQILSGKVDLSDREGALGKLFSGMRMLTTPLRIGMFTTFAREIDKRIKNRRLREVFYQYATYSGASPFKAPGTLAVIPFSELYFGGFYLEGGMYTLAKQLETLARKLGVDIRTDCTVKRIEVRAPPGSNERKSMQVSGITTESGELIEAEIVIANSDVVYSYRELIAPEARPRYSEAKLNKLEPGGSGMVLLLGVEGTYPQLAHHTKFMPADYQSDLNAMFETHSVPDDPCIYVCATTRSDPTQAPEGCENLFVLASAPALDGKIDWASESKRYRDQLVGTLEQRWGLTNLTKRIVVERTISPLDLQQLYNANAGSIYGLGSNSRKTAFLRPPNRDRDVRGLYFAGGATHPGGGLPLVALSGKIVSELVKEDFGETTPTA